MLADTLKIIPVRNSRQLKEFIRFPYKLYAQDRHWIPPLFMERKQTLDARKNPYFQHAEVELYLAQREGKTVGRISAQIDFEYEKFHGERVGHFGFFECENDPKVAAALLETAENFVKIRGVQKVLGPFSFSINEESGILIDGFHEPLMFMIPYNPAYYASLLEQQGYEKAKDLYAWRYEAGPVPEAPGQIAEAVSKHPGLTLRPLNKKTFKQDLQKIIDIFNSAWSQNWGFVPLTPAEVDKAAKDLQFFMDPEIAFLAEVDGDPAGMCLTVPNLYEFIHDLKGRLMPFGLVKLLWRIKRRKCKNARLMLLGIKKEYRGSALGALSVLLYVEIHKRGTRQGYDYGELSWTLEDNHKVNAGIEFMGGRRYKTMRVYQKALA